MLFHTEQSDVIFDKVYHKFSEYIVVVEIILNSRLRNMMNSLKLYWVAKENDPEGISTRKDCWRGKSETSELYF